MSVKSLNYSQRGTFTVEFAIVGLIFSLLFVFSGDVIIKLAYKGKLDRLAYSLVNIVKERTQLYDDSYSLTPANVTTVANIAEASLRRMITDFDSNKFGYVIEAVTFDASHRSTYQAFSSNVVGNSAIQCNTPNKLNQMMHLSKITTWGRPSTLYRVTLCYETANWIGDLLNMNFTRVESDAVMIGR